MPADVERIKDGVLSNPDFKPFPGDTREQSAWKVAWQRYRQTQKNNVALSMGADSPQKVEKESSFSAMGPDTGESKLSPKQGKKSELEDVDKPSFHTLEGGDVSGPHAEYPDTASERMGIKKHDADSDELEDALEDVDEEFAEDTEDSLDDVIQVLRDLRARINRHEEEEIEEDTESVDGLEILEFQKLWKRGTLNGISLPSNDKDKREFVDAVISVRKEQARKYSNGYLAKLLFTTKRGKVKSSSTPQHRLLHGRSLPHTHIEGGKYKRENLQKDQRSTPYPLLSGKVGATVSSIFRQPETVEERHRQQIREQAGYSIKKHYTGAGHEHLPWGQVRVPKPKGASWESGKIARDPATGKPGNWQGYVEKGGEGSGRRPSKAPNAVREAIGTYYGKRTPEMYQKVVEAFRAKEKGPELPETHPWDKPFKDRYVQKHESRAMHSHLSREQGGWAMSHMPSAQTRSTTRLGAEKPNVSGTPPRPGLTKNPLSRRWVNTAIGIRAPKQLEVLGMEKQNEHPADKLVRQLNRTKNPDVQAKITRQLQEKHGVSAFGNPNLSPIEKIRLPSPRAALNWANARAAQHRAEFEKAEPKLGTGTRFEQLKEKLARKPGVESPERLAAWIGRKKYGAKRMAELSAGGKKSSDTPNLDRFLEGNPSEDWG